MANFIADYKDLMSHSMRFYRKHWLALSLYFVATYYATMASLGVNPIDTTKFLYEGVKEHLKH